MEKQNNGKPVPKQRQNRFNQQPNSNFVKKVKRTATAPYNFIEFEKNAIVPSPFNEKSSAPLYSGTIRVTLRSLSPLLVAAKSENNSEDNKKKADKKRDLLRFNNKTPVIPGSSIKGMLRSLVEAFSFSSMLTVSDKPIFWRDVASNENDPNNVYKQLLKEDNLKVGFLRKRGETYELQEAIKRKAEDTVKKEYFYSSGEMIKRPKKLTHRKGIHSKYYIERVPTNKWNNVDRNRRVITTFKDQMKGCSQQEDLWDKGVHFQEQNSQPGKELISSKKGLPIFYYEENGEIKGIGLCRYFRISYDCTPCDLAKTNFDGIDFATRLFGISNDKTTIKGHIAVGAVHFTKYQDRKEPITAVLSSPHPSCIANYLVQGENVKANNLSSLNKYLKKDDPKLRGRKMYWHRDLIRDDDQSVKGNGNESVLSKLQTIENAQGEFVIYLDRVTEQELGALFTAIQLPSGYAHHLGSGKSLGLGSVRLEIKSIDVQNVKDRYTSLRSRLNLFTTTEERNLTENELNNQIKPYVNSFKEYVFSKIKNHFGKVSNYDELRPVKQIYMMLDYEHKPKNELTQNMPVSPQKDKNGQKDRSILTYSARSILKDIEDVYNS